MSITLQNKARETLYVLQKLEPSKYAVIRCVRPFGELEKGKWFYLWETADKLEPNPKLKRGAHEIITNKIHEGTLCEVVDSYRDPITEEKIVILRKL